MAKNIFLNIGKTLFKEISEKLLNEAKDKLISSGTEMLEKGTDALMEKVDKKFSNQTQDLAHGRPNEKISTPLSEISTEENATKEKVLKFAASPKNIDDAKIMMEEEKYADADKFEQNIHDDLNGLVTSFGAGNPVEAAEALGKLLNMAGEVGKFTEAQKTKRKDIEAQRDVYVEKIRAQKEIMIVYLEKSFDERKTNFEKLFEIVDDAIATNNMQQLAIGLQSINTLAATSSFKSLTTIESTQQALTDNSHVWDF